MKLWKKLGIGLLIALGAIQVVSCERSNPPVTAEIRLPPEMKSVLKRACYDCHSNETRWPWYSQVAPASWLLHHDVTEGRAELNFSEWESLAPERKAKLRRGSGKEVVEGDMPPWYYRALHPDAALSSADKQLLETWSRGAQESR